ncbi:MAG: coenzyme F420-0:L-glutamate ligase [Acidobacteria bacterium]|nr:MAG: coenzyme F420-0:L-glutamate ligase [Acidobacteriota bacterium]
MKLDFRPIEHLPEIRPGMNLAQCLLDRTRESEIEIHPQDIVAVTQKIISKAEGRIVQLCAVEASAQSIAIARRMKKDPRLVEVILSESRRIVRMRDEVLICETHHGFICANAGVDQSNVEGNDTVTLLPQDPDRSARELARILGCGVIVTDTFGRVWREGLVDTVIGIARVPPFIDFRGKHDSYGHQLQVTLLAAADSLAAAAGLVMGKTSRTPAVLIRGFPWDATESHAAMLLRTPEKDLFL